MFDILIAWQILGWHEQVRVIFFISALSMWWAVVNIILLSSCTVFLPSLALNMFLLYLLSTQRFVLVFCTTAVSCTLGRRQVPSTPLLIPYPVHPDTYLPASYPNPLFLNMWVDIGTSAEKKRCKAENIFPSPNIIQTEECVNSTQKKKNYSLLLLNMSLMLFGGEKQPL